MREGEKFLAVDNTNGKWSAKICMNGAAARLMHKGDEIIIMGFELAGEALEPKAVLADKHNKFIKFL